MGREGIESYEQLYDCQILDKYNLTDRKVPCITIKGGHIRFNMNAIQMLEGITYVEILINPDEKYMLVVPCEKNDIYAIDWCRISKKTGRTEPKDIRSKFLSPKLFNLMEWDARYSYKVQCFYQGFDNGKCLLFFDLTEYVTMVPETQKLRNGKTRKWPQPYYLADWQNSFGPPLHKVVEKVSQDFMGYYAMDEKDSEQAEKFEHGKGEKDGQPK